MPEPSLLQRCILLILEQAGSLESNFSIVPPCVYTEEYSFDYKKLHEHLSVNENPVKSIKSDDRRNILVLYYHLQCNTYLVTNNLFWFNLVQQLHPTQPLIHPPPWDGEEKEPLTVHSESCSALRFAKKICEEGRKEAGKESLRGNGYNKLMSFISACSLTFFFLINTSIHLQSTPAIYPSVLYSEFTQMERLL